MPRRDQPSVGAHLRLVPELHFGARARGCHAFTGAAGPSMSAPNSMLTKRFAPPQSVPGTGLQQASPGTDGTDQTQIGFSQSPSYTMSTLRAQGQEDGTPPPLTL
jgi:hypothetical protein